ncbi:uncharacterized protein LY89DRAFT_664427 [Mollisia scopiformis]|uniref:Uncharacterized protein n=1 Tax=Mollisia scopiformis TaxID=149040 RepID=A0A194XQS0_MOLSC|nr:uncharacterized protein LY89DRAFT_664427 [Mollisia scopiformis]KUJ22625.1 hypothetical protein LY89DRAFT_664427 [Mollisia scopiformis]
MSLLKPFTDAQKKFRGFKIGAVALAAAFPEEKRRAIERRHNIEPDCWAKVDFPDRVSAAHALGVPARQEVRSIKVQRYHPVYFWGEEKKLKSPPLTDESMDDICDTFGKMTPHEVKSSALNDESVDDISNDFAKMNIETVAIGYGLEMQLDSSTTVVSADDAAYDADTDSKMADAE